MRRFRAEISGRGLAAALAGAWVVAAASIALAGPNAGTPPDYGYQFVTIGAVGNRATLPHEVPTMPGMRVGAVNHEYRIAKTEVTGADWFAFVQAYAPFVGADFGNPGFTGPTEFRGFGAGGVPRYTLDAAYADRPAAFNWRYAARYCNWLHNGMAITQSAFSNGAYDTATFTTNADGSVNDQMAHNSGALFWMPTQDEWIKATYFDPNKNGQGEEGYWRHPGGQDTPLQGGFPGEPGAQTSAVLNGPGVTPDVGSYPHVSAPWGLLDASGGASEWTETGYNLSGGRRAVRGSQAGFGAFYYLFDQVDGQFYGHSTVSLNGLRVASVVPVPGASALACVMGCILTTRRSRNR